jgi:hypothetical protein
LRATCETVDNYQNKLIGIEEEIDNLVLAAVKPALCPRRKDQLELRHWVEERAKADTSAAAAVKITSKISLKTNWLKLCAMKLWRNKEQLGLSRQITFDQVCNFLNIKTEAEPEDRSRNRSRFLPTSLSTAICNRYLNSRFNQVLHEQFGGQPPVLTINGARASNLTTAEKWQQSSSRFISRTY